MKKKVMVGLVSVVVAVALVFGGVTFYNNRQQEKFEKQMASYESVDTMQQRHRLMEFKYRLARNRK